MKDLRITRPADALQALKNYANKRQEHFIVLTLNGAHQVIKRHVITIGLVNRTLVHPREVFFPAIKDNAAAIIIAHNHPSGQPEPSSDDRETTRRLALAGELLGIQVLDHLIIGKKSVLQLSGRRGCITQAPSGAFKGDKEMTKKEKIIQFNA